MKLGCSRRRHPITVIYGVLLLLNVFSFNAKAQEQHGPIDVHSFRGIIVLEEGRKKPIDTVARNFLIRLSGRSTVAGMSASEWMARAVFTPEATENDAIFKINHPEVVNALALTPAKGHRYSFSEIEKSIHQLVQLVVASAKVEEAKRSPVESELIRLYENITAYVDVRQTIRFLEPSSDFIITNDAIADYLGLPKTRAPRRFWDVFQSIGIIGRTMATLDTQNLKKMSPLQRDLLMLSKPMFEWASQYKDSGLALIPSAENGEEDFKSPWQMVAAHRSDPFLKEGAPILSDMKAAFASGNQTAFDDAIARWQKAINARLQNPSRDGFRVNVELFYNQVQPFFYAKWLYLITMIFSMFAMATLRKWVYRTTWALLSLAGGVHATGLVARFLITDRPPITNLYETFVFVGLIAVILGFVLEFIQRKSIGLFSASTLGLVLLWIAGRYSVDGDTLRVLIAVLDSNFWLSTHVVCITIGYAGCTLAGVIGHLYLWQTMKKNPNPILLKQLYHTVFGVLAFGLIFSFFGTMLGGIWADQSWGRFWGWDPKENGALIIVLWTALLFHARLAGIVRDFGFVVGTVLGIIVVMMAWFGVNLLNVGLHSYGFTTGIFFKLLIYTVLQVLFVLVALIIHRRHLKK